MNKGMIIATIVMAVLAITFSMIAYLKGAQQHVTGFHAAVKMTVKVLPLLVLAFIVAGMIQALIPKEMISNLIGEGSGIKGIIIGCIAGGLTPGGPYVSLPIVAGFCKSGASIGTTVAFVTAWSLWAFARLPLEVGILGYRFTLIRMASTFMFPILAGLIAQLLFSRWWNAEL